MSFVDQKAVMQLAEDAVKDLFAQLVQVDLPDFPVLTYQHVMQRYGSDKPDLRNPLFLVPCDDLFINAEFKVFADPANSHGSRVATMRLPGGCEKLSRKDLDHYTDLVMKLGAKGLAYIKVNDISAGMDGMQSPITKFLSWDIIERVLKRAEAENGDILFLRQAQMG